MNSADVPFYPIETAAAPVTVCVTGVAGYIGAVVAARLLAAGHTVHGTIRGSKNDEKRLAFLTDLPGANERLKLFPADLMVAGSFDEAVNGCEYVLHVASPNLLSVPKGKAKELLLRPAVQGVEHVLGAANRTPSVKRVVLTSSVRAVFKSGRGKEYTFTEQDWNEDSTEDDDPYSLSKVLAEKRAWELYGLQSRWELVVILPVLVYGPPVGSRADGESVGFMMKLCGGQLWPAAPDFGLNIVDVRDLAAIHCVAMLHPGAKGRYLAQAGSTTVLEAAKMVGRLFPGRFWLPSRLAPLWLVLLLAPLLKLNRSFIRLIWGKVAYVDNSKIRNELGISFVSIEATLRDMVNRMTKLGMIKK